MTPKLLGSKSALFVGIGALVMMVSSPQGVQASPLLSLSEIGTSIGFANGNGAIIGSDDFLGIGLFAAGEGFAFMGPGWMEGLVLGESSVLGATRLDMTLVYSGEIDGPTASSVLVDFSASVQATTTAANSSMSQALADIIIGYTGPGGIPQGVYDSANVNGLNQCCGSPIAIEPGTPFQVEMDIELQNNVPITGCVPLCGLEQGGTVFAEADPVFTIDPSNANAGAYSVVLADGIDNVPPTFPPLGPSAVPEPTTLTLIGLGVAGFLTRPWHIRRF